MHSYDLFIADLRPCYQRNKHAQRALLCMGSLQDAIRHADMCWARPNSVHCVGHGILPFATWYLFKQNNLEQPRLMSKQAAVRVLDHCC